jgi:hypothetical protein
MKTESLVAGLSRFRIAYDTGIARDIEPLSREAVEQAFKLIGGCKAALQEFEAYSDPNPAVANRRLVIRGLRETLIECGEIEK